MKTSDYERICIQVASVCNVDVDLLISGSRRHDIAEARHLMTWALWKNLNSKVRVAEIIGKDHTTVINSIKAAQRMMNRSPVLKSIAESLAVSLFSQELATYEERFRNLVKESSATFGSPSKWPLGDSMAKRIAQSVALNKAKEKNIDPRKVNFQPIMVSVDKYRFNVLLESVYNPKTGQFHFTISNCEEVLGV